MATRLYRALNRIGVRDGEANEFEKRESLQFCRDLFLPLKDESFVQVIDTNASIEDVHQRVIDVVASA